MLYKIEFRHPQTGEYTQYTDTFKNNLSEDKLRESVLFSVSNKISSISEELSQTVRLLRNGGLTPSWNDVQSWEVKYEVVETVFGQVSHGISAVSKRIITALRNFFKRVQKRNVDLDDMGTENVEFDCYDENDNLIVQYIESGQDNRYIITFMVDLLDDAKEFFKNVGEMIFGSACSIID